MLLDNKLFLSLVLTNKQTDQQKHTVVLVCVLLIGHLGYSIMHL